MTSPTRAAFLAAGAAALAGCAKNRGSGILPGLSPSAKERATSATPALPIPQAVLMSPIVGEARRYDGAVAPAGWIKLEGQRLPVGNYRQLVAILGKGGSHDAATFLLPAAKLGWIVAVAGTYPSSARALESLHRGARMKLDVSVDGAEVYPAPLAMVLPEPAGPKVDPWYPGTAPTPEQIEAARRTAMEAALEPRTEQYHGTPNAISQ